MNMPVIQERTLVVIKPDGMEDGLQNVIQRRIKMAGLEIIAEKKLVPTREILNNHFPIDDFDWIRNMGKFCIANFYENEADPVDILGSEDPVEVGRMILQWNFKAYMSGHVLAMIVQGENAVQCIRGLIGHTNPSKAKPGTIRGDFSQDDGFEANKDKRAIQNVIHASGTAKEVEKEIAAWFPRRIGLTLEFWEGRLI